jgi:methylmalonyl-CoA/ethylmalonyl-CoA epimerase
MMSDRTLDHIGIAVSSLETGAGFWEALGLSLTGCEEVPEQQVRVGFIEAGGTRIELLEATSPGSPIARHLEKRGPGLHHLCLRVTDIRSTMERLKAAGYRLLTDEPQPGAHGCQVCFVHPKSAGGVLLELSQPVRVAERKDKIEGGSLVILHCVSPKEKLWGVLIRADSVGMVIRGLELGSVEDWLQQEKQQGEPLIGPSTQLIPMHRVERVYLDESTPVIMSYGDRYAAECGGDACEALTGQRDEDGA